MSENGATPKFSNSHDGLAAAKDARLRSKRERICNLCVREADKALGLLHTEAACQRCGAAPCHGIVTVGPINLPSTEV
jgi:hypothetical protein